MCCPDRWLHVATSLVQPAFVYMCQIPGKHLAALIPRYGALGSLPIGVRLRLARLSDYQSEPCTQTRTQYTTAGRGYIGWR